MDAHVNDLLLDLDEIKSLEAQAQREGVRRRLVVWRAQVEQEIANLKLAAGAPQDAGTAHATKSAPKPKLFTKKITTYAWDQSDKFVKIFVSGLQGVQDIPKERVALTFDGMHYTLNVSDLNKSNYQFSVPKLLHDVSASTLKIKTNEVVIMLKKLEILKTWETLSEKDKKEKDNKKPRDEPKLGTDVDPSKGLMDMMRDMYDQGDDNMKQTIAKAWTESQEKQMAAGGGSGI